MCCIVLTSSQSVCVGSQGNSGVIKSQDQSFDALYGMYHSINLHVLSSGLIRGVNRQYLRKQHTLSTGRLQRFDYRAPDSNVVMKEYAWLGDATCNAFGLRQVKHVHLPS